MIQVPCGPVGSHSAGTSSIMGDGTGLSTAVNPAFTGGNNGNEESAFRIKFIAVNSIFSFFIRYEPLFYA